MRRERAQPRLGLRDFTQVLLLGRKILRVTADHPIRQAERDAAMREARPLLPHVKNAGNKTNQKSLLTEIGRSSSRLKRQTRLDGPAAVPSTPSDKKG